MIEFIKEAAFGLAVGQLVLIAAIFVIAAAAAAVFGLMFLCSVVVGEVKGKVMANQRRWEPESLADGEFSDWVFLKWFTFVMVMGAIGAIIGKLL